MKQIARNVTMEGWGALRDCRYLLHDRDTKFTRSFRAIIASGRVEPLALPVRSPDLNAYSERWVRSVEILCSTAAHAAILYAFDLNDHDCEDLRNLPFLDRKAALTRLLRDIEVGILLNEHIAENGPRSSVYHGLGIFTISYLKTIQTNETYQHPK